MISAEAIPIYRKEKADLIDLISKMEQPEFKDIDWFQEQIKFYRKRIDRIDELIKQRLEWDGNPMIIALKQNPNTRVRIL